MTYLRESGAPVVKTYTVPPTSRFNIDAGTVPELQNESFGAQIEVTNGVAIVVERSMYWDANGVFWPAARTHRPRVFRDQGGRGRLRLLGRLLGGGGLAGVEIVPVQDRVEAEEVQALRLPAPVGTRREHHDVALADRRIDDDRAP